MTFGTLLDAYAACDVNYVGPVDGVWNTGANWDSAAVPTSGQNACIPAAKGTIVIGTGVSATVRTIMASSGLQIASGGSLAISDATNGFTNSMTNLSVVSGGSATSAGSSVSINGTVVVDGSFAPGVQLTGGSLSGTGTVGGGLFNNGGTVRPGGAGVVGTLHIGSAFNQSTTGTLELDLASDVSFDKIDGPNNNHFVDGTIAVTLLGVYVPSVNTTWDFIIPNGFGTSIPATVTPAQFSAFPIPMGGRLSLDMSLSSTTTTSTTSTTMTTVVGSTTTTSTSTTTSTEPPCGNGMLDQGEECDGATFGGTECTGVTDQSCRLCSDACTLDCTQCVAAPVDAFILPVKVSVKRNATSPEKSRLVTAGIFDTGPGAADLSSPATLRVGSVLAIATTPTPSKGGFVLKSDGFLFKVVPARTGSSKAKFKLRWVRDLTNVIDSDGPLPIEFADATVEGRGVVRLSADRYRLRKRPGDLIEPVLYLAKVRAKVVGGGKDSLLLQVGFAGAGTPPASASTVTLRFGSTYALTVPGDAFTASGPRLTADIDTGRVTLDYVRELMTVKVKGVDLGAFTDGAQAVRIALQVGTDTRANDVRVVKKGKGLKY